MIDFEELEDKIFSLGMQFASKKSSIWSFEEEQNTFDELLNNLVVYNNIIIKTAETKVFNVQTIKDAKELIKAFRIGIDYLNSSVNRIKIRFEEGKTIKSLIENLFIVKKSFEDLISAIDNYLLKLNGREYAILNDYQINCACVRIIEMFYELADYFNEQKIYGSFVNDISRMCKRYNYFKNIQTIDLRNAIVVSKTII